MDLFERGLQVVITIVLIIGGYQFYFWAQRRRWFEAMYLETSWDSRITYDPRWVWVYSGLYYPMIVLAGLSVSNWRDFALAVGCYLALLVVQLAFFLFMPVEIPETWRTSARIGWENTRSQRFMDLVWSYDKLRNSMPSMHVSVAMVTDLTIGARWPALGVVCIAFPVLIAISALKTKQHYVVDVIPGAVLGAAVFWAWRAFASS